MSGSVGSLVVRVKRRRDQAPAETLLIVEDDHPRTKKAASEALSGEMGKLSTSSAQGGGTGLGRSVVLRRMATMTSAQGNQMDSVVSSLQGAPEAAGASSVSGGGASMWITQGRSVFQSQADGTSYVVVDLSQVKMRDSMDVGDGQEVSSSCSGGSSSAGGGGAVKRSPIRDPPTRNLEAAIEKAILTSDFNDLSYAILQGANPNYQRPLPERPDGSSTDPADPLPGGETALMAAARQGNVRMVDRLVSLGVNVFATDALGRTAMDLARAAPARSASQEIALKLHSAAIKAHREAAPAQIEGGVDGDYEVDVFYAAPASSSSSSSSSAAPHEEAGPASDAWAGLSFAHAQPVVRVDGLRIGRDGLAEIELTYDSDWSDLGDDEDPDSNDERYHGNDYPDEEEGDEEEQDEDSEANAHLGIGRADLDSEEEEEERRLNGTTQPAAKARAPRAGRMDDSDDEGEGGDDEDEDEQGGQSRFLRKPIGRVVRPMVQGGDHLCPPHSRESIRAVWGETGGLDEDDEDDEDGEGGGGMAGDEGAAYSGILRQGFTLRDRFSAGGQGMGPSNRGAAVGQGVSAAHRQRLAKMRAVSGLDFGAAPREFAPSGLAKFGMELSDGEDEGAAPYHAAGRPPPGTVAYDPYLDDDDDDDDNL